LSNEKEKQYICLMNLQEKVNQTYMTATEYAKKYSKSRQTVHNMINDGRLDSITIAGRKFVKV